MKKGQHKCRCVFAHKDDGALIIINVCGYHAERERLIIQMKAIGSQMSNLCFNGKQQDRVPDDFRETMTKLQKEWDALK